MKHTALEKRPPEQQEEMLHGSQDEAVRDGLRSAARWTKRLSEATEKQHEVLVAALDRMTLGMRASETLWDGVHAHDAEERESLSEKRARLAKENQEIVKASADLEEHATRLASLYTAIFQLHAALELPAVLKSVCEVVLNLIGAEEFVVWLADEAGWVEVARDADLVSEGRRLPELEHVVERLAASERKTILRKGGPSGPISATPLIFQGSCVGLLSVQSLLSHKKSLSALDRELFDLLGEQAASAIISARTFSTVDRKLRTAKGFISLLG
jgi:hypothetical protein